ncbi:hypothetical protein AADZ90_007140 [Aestuariibius sp. 2305UL40-4]|uniref:hypothetical protein n=1 Tax=Aestuariibius violaceus TaxID=3234132 RepID=UPI00345F1410
MLQFDIADQSDNDTDVSGQGWLVGPYFASPIAGHPVYVERDFEIDARQRDLWFDLGVSGIYSEVSSDGAATAYIPNEDGGRARIDYDLRYDNGSRVTSSLAGFVDGLGSESGLQTHGQEFELQMKF